MALFSTATNQSPSWNFSAELSHWNGWLVKIGNKATFTFETFWMHEPHCFLKYRVCTGIEKKIKNCIFHPKPRQTCPWVASGIAAKLHWSDRGKEKIIQPEDKCNTIFRKMQPCFLIMYNLFKDIHIMCSFQYKITLL